jgi:ribosomal RNA-processing protein 9
LTTGSRDRTCRLWKILEESQLVFRGGGGLKASEDLVVMEGLVGTGKKREKDSGLSGGSIDVVAMINEDFFVSGSDSGAISLWSTTKKKPIFTKLKCHGLGTVVKVNGQESKVEGVPATTPFDDTTCSWITSLATVRYSDMFASGSGDGFIRLWKLSDTKKSFGLINCIPCEGFVNDLIFFEAPLLSYSSKAAAQKVGGSAVVKKIVDSSNEERRIKNIPLELYMAAAIGQEYRLGRWWRRKDVKNRIMILPLPKSTT